MSLKVENSEAQRHPVICLDEESQDCDVVTTPTSEESNQDSSSTEYVDVDGESRESPVFVDQQNEETPEVKPAAIPTDRNSTVDLSCNGGKISESSPNPEDDDSSMDVQILSCYSLGTTAAAVTTASSESGNSSDNHADISENAETTMTSINSVAAEPNIGSGCFTATSEQTDFGSHVFSLDKKGGPSGPSTNNETDITIDEGIKPGTSSSLHNARVPKSQPINAKATNQPSKSTPANKAEYQSVIETTGKKAVPKKARSEMPNTSDGGGCFNCLGNHFVRDCQKKLDVPLIHKRRMKYKAQSRRKDARYRAKAPEDGFSQCKPGTISKELRAALGLNNRQQPGYVVNMKKYGYPPGWREHARAATSRLQNYGQNTEHIPQLKQPAMLDNLFECAGFMKKTPGIYQDDGGSVKEEDSVHNVAMALLQLKRGGEGTLLTKANASTTVSPHQTGRPRLPSFDSTKERKSQWNQNLLISGSPTSFVSKNEDERAVEDIFQRVIMRRRSTQDEMRSLSFSQLSTNQNYRITEELERREEEMAKRLAMQKSPEVPKRRIVERPRSPSLLETPTQYDSNSSWGDDTNNKIDEDEIKIVDEVSKSKKRPLDVITIESDDEGENEKDEKNKINPTMMVPNPVYKKMKMSDGKSNGHKFRPSAMSIPPPSSFHTVVSSNATKLSNIMPPWLQDDNAVVTSQNNYDSHNTKMIDEVDNYSERVNPEVLSTLKKHDEGSNSMTFADLPLPSISNFAKDMTPMHLQESSLEYTGRLDKVLKVIQSKKASSPVETSTDDDDDDIQIIEEFNIKPASAQSVGITHNK